MSESVDRLMESFESLAPDERAEFVSRAFAFNLGQAFQKAGLALQGGAMRPPNNPDRP